MGKLQGHNPLKQSHHYHFTEYLERTKDENQPNPCFKFRAYAHTSNPDLSFNRVWVYALMLLMIMFVKQVDLNHFATFKLNTILFNHINDLTRCHQDNISQFSHVKTFKDRLAKQHDLFKLIVEKNEGSCHFALKSRKHELIYLRQICKQILPFLLPESVQKCKLDIVFFWIFSIKNYVS